MNNGSLGGVDLADNTLGDREINEPQLDIQVLGGIDAKRYVRRVSRVQTETASDANPGEERTAGPLPRPEADHRRRSARGLGRSGSRRAERQRSDRQELAGRRLRHRGRRQLAVGERGDLRVN